MSQARRPAQPIGVRHVPLAQLLHTFLDAGLLIDKVTEPELRHPGPFILELRLTRLH